MYTVIVTLDVKPSRVEEFIEAMSVNSRASLHAETGCLRFDVHRSVEDSNRFYLYELYRDEQAFLVEHRSTDHYAQWRSVSERVIADGGHRNAFARPLFPDRIPEHDPAGLENETA